MYKISPIEKVLESLKIGKPILLVDHRDRENEADLVIAAEHIDEIKMGFFIRYGSGIVCLCIKEDLAKKLNLNQMVSKNDSRYQTAFTVSIEAKDGITTGVSAKDRVRTIRLATDEGSSKDSLVSPGHVFPIVAKNGGVLERAGHTEGSIDLVTLSGLKPQAVLVEVMNDDGTMCRGDDLERFAKRHTLDIFSIDELITYKMSLSDNILNSCNF